MVGTPRKHLSEFDWLGEHSRPMELEKLSPIVTEFSRVSHKIAGNVAKKHFQILVFCEIEC